MVRFGKFSTWLTGLSAGLLLAGCTNAASTDAPDPVGALAQHGDHPGGYPEGWAQIEQLDPDFVIFGEIHGTAESPQFFAGLAASLAAQGKNILVAVELSASDNALVQKAWQVPHAEFESHMRRIMAGRQDGVASRAMLRSLSRLHALKQDGAKLSLLAFNGYIDEAQQQRLDTPASQQGHEAAQAENILNAASRSDYDHVLILVGEAHARKTMVEHTGAQYMPMAMHLMQAGRLVSLKMASSGGSAWSCILKDGVRPVPGQPVTTDMLDCANHPLKGVADTGRMPHFALGPLPGMDEASGFDGYYWLGSVSGSPPAQP